MKFSKLGALALASLMILSACSKEETQSTGVSGVEDAKPGEALIVFNLKANGSTTYSSIQNETIIRNGNARLFDAASGKEIPMTHTEIAADGMFRGRVAPHEVTNKEAILYLYVNTEGGTEALQEGQGGSAMANHENTTVWVRMEKRNLPNGAPAGYKSRPFQLVEGPIVIDGSNTGKAKRAIARLGAKNMSSLISLGGLKVKISGINLSRGFLYAGLKNSGDVIGAKGSLEYTLEEDRGPDAIDFSGNYDNTQTITYLYPSTSVTVEVSAPGKTKSFTFNPLANMNYTLKITPAPVPIQAWTDFKLEMEAKWDTPNNVDTDIDLR